MKATKPITNTGGSNSKSAKPAGKAKNGKVKKTANKLTTKAKAELPPQAKAKSKSKSPASPRIHFEISAPDAGMVFLAGTFNEWDPSMNPMKKSQKGLWTTDIDLSPGRYEYLFVVDETWTFDPSAVEFAPNPFGSSNSLKMVA
jgi:1,4-alpha-glucan branching enzyme